MKNEQVILVDLEDNPIGEMEKMEAHEKALLHRAFSVFVFNDRGELLLQQRALDKYHSGGLWTNTCCSHQRPGESTLEAAGRRLNEEMGMSCTLQEVFTFVYKKPLDKGLTEHEFDHVLIGYSNENPVPNPSEVANWKFASTEWISKDMNLNPGKYTEWMKICYPKVLTHQEH